MNHKAIYALYPTVHSVDANGIAHDIEGNQVEIDMAAVNAWVDSDIYKEQRARAYPSFADQFDLLYHGGYDAWKAAIDAVKTQYPKV
jgi:hypothetical protein